MRYFCIICLAMVAGCFSATPPMLTSQTVSGKLTVKGKPLGNVLLTLQPLENGHTAPLNVSKDGSFTAEIVPGKYAYFVGKLNGKSSDAALKEIGAQYYEADLSRTVTVSPGTELKINID